VVELTNSTRKETSKTTSNKVCTSDHVEDKRGNQKDS